MDSSAGTKTAKHTPNGKFVVVVITYDPSNSDRNKKITVDADKETFWVSKSNCEQVHWSAKNKDGSSPGPEFTVDFTGNGSPFHHTHFTQDVPFSGLVRREVLADQNKIYKYSIWIGEAHLDPGGGVKP